MHRGKFQIYNHYFNLTRFLFNRNTHTREKAAGCVKYSMESRKNAFFLELYLNSIEFAVLTSQLLLVPLQHMTSAASLQFTIEEQNSAVTEMGSSSGR